MCQSEPGETGFGRCHGSGGRGPHNPRPLPLDTAARLRSLGDSVKQMVVPTKGRVRTKRAKSPKKKGGRERLTSSLTTMVRIRFLHRVLACDQNPLSSVSRCASLVGAWIRCSGSAESFEKRWRRGWPASLQYARPSFVCLVQSCVQQPIVRQGWAGLGSAARKGSDDGRDVGGVKRR